MEDCGGIGSASASSYGVTSASGAVIVTLEQCAPVRIVDAQGCILFYQQATGVCRIGHLATGIYLVQVGDQSAQKVVVVR